MSVEKVTREEGGDQGPRATSTPRPSPWSFVRSLVTEAALLAVCAVFWVQTREFEQDVGPGELGPAFVPRLLIVLLALCVLIRVVQQLLEFRRPAPEVDQHAEARTDRAAAGGHVLEEGTIAEEEYPTDGLRLLLGFALAVGYVVGTIYLGYPLATLLVIIAFISTASKLTWTAVLVGLVTALVFPYVFVKVVFIALPTGVWVFDDFTVWLYNLLGIY